MFNRIYKEQLLKTICAYSSLEHPVNIEDILTLKRIIGQDIIICKELLKRCNSIKEAERLYNSAHLIVHLQNY